MASWWVFGTINTFSLLPRYKVANKEINETKEDKNDQMETDSRKENDDQKSKQDEDTTEVKIDDVIKEKCIIVESFVNQCFEEDNIDNNDQATKEEAEESNHQENHVSKQTDNEDNMTNTDDTIQDTMRPHPSFKQCFLSPLYISHLIWFSLIMFRNSLFLGTLLPWLSDIYPRNDKKVAFYLMVSGFITLPNVILAPLWGYAIDWSAQKCKTKCKKDLWARAEATQYVLLATSIIGILLSIACLNTQEWSIYSTFVLILLYTPGVTGPAYTLVSIVYPIEHHGKLMLLLETVAAIVQFIQIPLLHWAENSSFFNMNLVVLFITGCTLVHPIYIILKAKMINRALQPQK